MRWFKLSKAPIPLETLIIRASVDRSSNGRQACTNRITPNTLVCIAVSSNAREIVRLSTCLSGYTPALLTSKSNLSICWLKIEIACSIFDRLSIDRRDGDCGYLSPKKISLGKSSGVFRVYNWVDERLKIWWDSGLIRSNFGDQSA